MGEQAIKISANIARKNRLNRFFFISLLSSE
jgi:hypothetical protein